MRYEVLTFALLLAFSGSSLEGSTMTRQAQGVDLVAKDGSLRARIVFDVDAVLLDFVIQQRAYLFRPESYISINRSAETYRVHSYANLLDTIPKREDFENPNWKDDASRLRAGGFIPTEDIDLLAGFNATKIERTSQGKVEIEIWASEEITPMPLRALGQRIREILPTNYWGDYNPMPTLVQTILVFGVPLKIVNHQSESDDVEAVAIRQAAISLEIPSGYRWIE